MAELDEALEGLIKAIKASKEYEKYELEKEKVKRFPDLKAQIDQYRELNYRLQDSTEDSELFHKIEEFEREYEKFREDPLVSDFLAAELAFCRMMQKLDIQLTAALDFE